MRFCNKCQTNKSILSFAVNKRRKDLLCLYCKDCNNEYKRKWQIANKDKVAEYDKVWQQSNKDKKAKNYKNWQLNNRHKVNSYNSKRRALEVSATPAWLTTEHKSQIESFYWLAKMQNELTDDVYHVDHMIPLKGKTVCGLHVPWNLQVLVAKENLSKSNKV